VIQYENIKLFNINIIQLFYYKCVSWSSLIDFGEWKQSHTFVSKEDVELVQ